MDAFLCPSNLRIMREKEREEKRERERKKERKKKNYVEKVKRINL